MTENTQAIEKRLRNAWLRRISADLPQADQNCEAAVEHMNHSHDEDENMELVETLHRYNLHTTLPFNSHVTTAVISA